MSIGSDWDDPPRVLTMPDLKGPNLSASAIADAVEFVLRDRLPGFLRELELPEPTAYRQQPSLRALQAADPPVVAIVVSGFASAPSLMVRGGRRTHDVVFEVTVGYWLRGEDWRSTTAGSQDYGAAVRAALLTSTEGLEGRWVVTGEFYSDADDEGSRTLAAGYVEIEATVRDAIVPAQIGGHQAAEFTSVDQTLTPTRSTPRPTGA